MAHTRHSKKTNSKVTWQSQYLFNPQTALYALGAFLMCVFFMGGGARDDIQSLIILRPFAILCIAFALIYKIEMKIKWQSFPLNLLFLLTLLMIVQLIPLPPELWTQLPQRQIFADIANISAIEQPWRPLSLSPSKTWNSLFSLTVPFAAMALFMNLQPHDRRRAMLIIIALLALSAAWGILQSLGSARGPLYLYRITNHGVAVGLFANRNHQSFMLASLILFLGWYSFSLQHREKINPLKIIAVMGGIFMLIPLIFITGSRAGLILMVPALFAALYFFYSGGKSKRKRRPDHSKKLGKSIKIMDRVKAHSNTIILFAIAFAIVSLAIGSVIFSRSLAFDRLFADGGLEGLRLKATPILLMMASEYMPFGSGFGSFEHVYKIYEPNELLSPNYFNQAHNDWLQLLIEGGALAALILITFIIWIGRHIITILRHWKKLNRDRYTIMMCIMFFLLAGAASVGDYPLRVPIVMAISGIVFSYFGQKMSEIKTAG